MDRVSTVSASTHTIALNAIVFLYADVLEKPLGQMTGLKRVQRQHRIPVVLTTDEVKAIFDVMNGTCRPIAQLPYGAGLRVSECIGLSVKDIDFGAKTLTVRDGKGGKDTTTLLPAQLTERLQKHLVMVAQLHFSDIAKSGGYAAIPNAIYREYPAASLSITW